VPRNSVNARSGGSPSTPPCSASASPAPASQGATNGHDGHERDRPALPPQRARVELGADREEVGHHGDLAEHAEDLARLRRKEGARQIPGQDAEDRRPEDEAGEHLPEHRGLADTLEHPA
jgi:hypothetical protein